MAIECQCGVGMIVAWGADGYRVSVWSGSASYRVASPNRLVYSQKFPLPPIPLFLFVFSQSPELLNNAIAEINNLLSEIMLKSIPD